VFAGKDVLSVASFVPTLVPSHHYALFTRGDILVLLSNTGKKKGDQIDRAAVEGAANPPHTVLSCTELEALGSRWGHICAGLAPGGGEAPCAGVTQPALLEQQGQVAKVDCMCRAPPGKTGMEVCFGPGKGGEPAVFALG
jgi:hypothetical protein